MTDSKYKIELMLPETASEVKRVNAIKGYRALTGCSLKHAKDVIDAVIDRPSTSYVFYEPNIQLHRPDRTDAINTIIAAGINIWVERIESSIVEKMNELIKEAIDINEHFFAQQLLNVLVDYKGMKGLE